ncbi:CCA tRNA nucleotidyltransferase [[Limnothrix rosea] IAM M-220]|uniref:CCA tRNA nucleotidyltransferase n=1 Tax=[Limnothrix rosea] IAM M-220 TaxID=454133 RepID=UPI00095C6469|nr:CCA tRNA nucleotidyltransferase [[Limnothrix rosea] IAM M-220]OKH11526.1 [cytidine(C)-cytidine(C)-adenosine (A)]-adding enzyme [[Limnothrix rosea] IAM M-220]
MALASPQQRLADFLRSLPFSVAELPSETCLVGGAVRDALLQRQSQYIDFDFVLPERAVETAREISQRYKAGFVVLDPERHIARVVFPQGTLDFAQQEGKTLETDLYRRDYRANAIAYHIRSNHLIDPLEGLLDLDNRVLRMVAAENLADDPLRLLRAYRQAAQLGFSIDGTTRAKLREFAPLIEKVAAERVQHELNYLLEHAAGDRWLAAAYEDGILSYWLTNLSQQGIKHLQQIQPVWQQLVSQFPAFQENPRWLYLAKLACLVGRTSTDAQQSILNLKYSRQELRSITLIVDMLPKLLAIADQPMTLREQYLFFVSIKDCFPITAIVAQANGLAFSQLEPLLQRYFDPTDQVAHPQPLVTGKDLIEQLNLKPSPQIGALLIEIQVAHIEGKIHTPDEAIQWGRSHLSQ